MLAKKLCKSTNIGKNLSHVLKKATLIQKNSFSNFSKNYKIINNNINLTKTNLSSSRKNTFTSNKKFSTLKKSVSANNFKALSTHVLKKQTTYNTFSKLNNNNNNNNNFFNKKRFFASEAAASSSGEFKFTLSAPHHVFVNQENIQSVTVPGISGQFGILAGHVPVISELTPGVVTVTFLDGKKSDFFVSSGFAFMHRDNTCSVNAVEVAPLEDLDPEAAKTYLKDAEKDVNSNDPEVSAIANINVSVYNAILGAVGSK